MGKRNINKVIDGYGSVLFADIVSFTVFSTTLAHSPMELVLVLNEMFQQFDKAAVSKILFFCKILFFHVFLVPFLFFFSLEQLSHDHFFANTYYDMLI